MGFIIPVINKDVSEIRSMIEEKMAQEHIQKRMVLVITAIALLLDNMLYMVIVPIIPRYLRDMGTYEEVQMTKSKKLPNGTMVFFNDTDYVGEDEMLGYLFASKAIFQLIVNPFSGTLIDRIGYEVPMMIGLSVLFFSTTIFAFGRSYGVLFFARSIQGLGSAFADTSGLAMIADRFTQENERSKALGIALAFISFGCLVAPPFGGIMYDAFGEPAPFIFLALLCVADAVMVFMVIKPKIRKTQTGERLKGTPIYKLFMDPYILVCAGALVMANVSLAFLEPTIGVWMDLTMPGVTNSQIGLVWLPAFFPHVLGVYATVFLMRKYPQHPWVLTAIGLVLEGTSCFFLPFCKTYVAVIFPLCVLCFGIALIDTSVLPLLAYLVDTRHVSVYGSVYAIADISYCLAYAFGPIVAGKVAEKPQGFFSLNLGICLSNLLYVPVLVLLRTVYQYRPHEQDQLEGDTYKGGYGTYNPADGDFSNGTVGEGMTAIQNDNFVQQGKQSKPGENVEWKGTLFERKVKKKNAFRDYRETDAILGDEEDEEEEGDNFR